MIRLTQGELVITDSLNIDGTSATNVLITGDANGDDVTVSGSNITDVSASFGGTAGATDDLLDDNVTSVKFLRFIRQLDALQFDYYWRASDRPR